MKTPDTSKENWRSRYVISVAVLLFFAVEFNRLVDACTSAAGCREGITTQTLIDATQQGLFWSFFIIILGRGAQPLINRLAFWKFGGGSMRVRRTVTSTETEKQDAKSQ